MSLALGHPKVAPVQVWVALEQETFLGLSSPYPKRLLAPSLIDFRGKSRNLGLVPGNRDPNPRFKVVQSLREVARGQGKFPTKWGSRRKGVSWIWTS